METLSESNLSANLLDGEVIETWNQQRELDDMRAFVENRLQLLADEPELV